MYKSRYDWILRTKDTELNSELTESFKLTELNKQILENRGFTTEKSLKSILTPESHDPYLVYNMEEATSMITYHLNENKNILIYGDYDADGITSTVILYEALKKRSDNIYYFIPNRVEHGYGPNYDFFKEKVIGKIDLVITVDNGITAVEEIDLLREHDIDVIIIDHHEFSEKIPDAIVIHPNHPHGNYPCETLAGVGITYKVLEALEFTEPHFIQLVAIGTVADMVLMAGENKRFVIDGLAAMNKNMYKGIQALLDVANFKNDIDEEAIGFTIAPRLNSTGRIDEASLGVELLISKEDSVIDEIASQIESLNEERKVMVDDTFKEALEQTNTEDNVQILYNELWHPGVLGIVASRVVERFGVPAILLTKEEEIYKGSSRSIDTIDLLSTLKNINVEHVAHGHSQAFGITIPSECMEQFKLSCVEYMNENQTQLRPTKTIDLKIKKEKITLDHVIDLKQLKPFGQGFLPPTFMFSEEPVESVRQIGHDKSHLKMTLKNYSYDLIGFRFGHIFHETAPGERINIIGEFSINEFNGVKKIQMIVEDVEIKDLQFIDMRSKNDQNFNLIHKNDIFFIEETREKIGDNYYQYGETVENTVETVVLRDLPIQLNHLKKSLKTLTTSKLIVIFDDSENLFFSGIPKEQTVKHVYKTILNAKNGAIDLKIYAPKFAERHHITMDMLLKITNILEDLDRIRVKEGIVFYNPNNTEDFLITESDYYNHLIAKLESETRLKMTSRSELRSYLENIMNNNEE